MVSLAAVLSALAGCSSVQQSSYPYLGTARYAPVAPAHVAILTEEPKQAKDKLGEVRLVISGSPDRDRLEKRLAEGAAKMGADAVFIVYDKMHVFPITYVDWWGPSATELSMQRNIVGIAVKYK